MDGIKPALAAVQAKIEALIDFNPWLIPALMLSAGVLLVMHAAEARTA